MHALILGLKASSKHLPRFDGVWTCSVFLLLLIWVFAPTQVGETLRFLLSSLIYMAPIVLVAIYLQRKLGGYYQSLRLGCGGCFGSIASVFDLSGTGDRRLLRRRVCLPIEHRLTG